jgi:hypothetical protein
VCHSRTRRLPAAGVCVGGSFVARFGHFPRCRLVVETLRTSVHQVTHRGTIIHAHTNTHLLLPNDQQFSSSQKQYPSVATKQAANTKDLVSLGPCSIPLQYRHTHTQTPKLETTATRTNNQRPQLLQNNIPTTTQCLRNAV